VNRSWVNSRALKWSTRALIALFATIAVIILALALVDANRFRGPLARFITARTGRDFRIDGPLEAHLFSLTPRLVAQGVAIGNPPWMPPGPTAEVGKLSLSFEWLPLFSHSFVISRLELEGSALHLARVSDGRANWQAHEPGTADAKGPPLIHSLSMHNAHVELNDARRHLQFDGTVSAQDVHNSDGVSPLRIDGAGQLNGGAVTFTIDGDPLATVRRGQPYHFAFEELSSGSRLSARGSLPRPFDFRTLDANFEAQGEDLKDLFFLVGVTLPNTGAYHLSGKLARQGMHFQYRDLVATSGQSDMHGTLSIDISSGRPKLEAELNSQVLRLADLGERAAGRAEESEAAKPLVLPDNPLRLVGIRRDDSTVTFRAQTIVAGAAALHAVAAEVTIDHGVLTVPSFSAVIAEGKLTGHMRFDATHEVPTANLDFRIANLRLGQFGRKDAAEPPLDGLLQARLNLKGKGISIHELASSADGRVTLVLPHGAIRNSFAELTGIDVTRALGLMMRKNRQETPVRCGVVSFQVHAGTATSDSLIIDTDPVLITGKGDIHLDAESLDLAIRGRPKSWRLVRLRSPVMVRGTLKHPSVGIDARNSMVQVGEAVALGVALTPLAAVLAFIDPGLAKDADCAALLAAAKSDDGPPAAPAVPAH
jgi:AsmA family protein